jgi:radical SAM-linked protein
MSVPDGTPASPARAGGIAPPPADAGKIPTLPATRWRLRLGYAKTGRMRFISHLDLIRLFERTARRVGLPLSMSEGYSPAPRIAYGWPLPVGMSGLGEYVDLELVARVAPEAAMATLNRALPKGFEIREARYISPHGPSAMAEFNTGSYMVQLPAQGRELSEWRRAVEGLLERSRLEVTRVKGAVGGDHESKSKVVDVRPLIRRVEARAITPDGQVAVFMELELGGKGSGRPDEVAGLILGELTGQGPEAGDHSRHSGPEAGDHSRHSGPEAGRHLRPSGMVAVRLGFRRQG